MKEGDASTGVARTCSLGPRLMSFNRARTADLQNRSGLPWLWQTDKTIFSKPAVSYPTAPCPPTHPAITREPVLLPSRVHPIILRVFPFFLGIRVRFKLVLPLMYSITLRNPA